MLPSGAADSIVDFFAADENENIETKITTPVDTSEMLVKLVVTTDEKTQRAIASFLDAVYPAQRIKAIKQANEQELKEAIGDDVSLPAETKPDFRESHPDDEVSKNTDLDWKSTDVERKVKVKKQESDKAEKFDAPLKKDVPESAPQTVDDLFEDDLKSVSQTLSEIEQLLDPDRKKAQTRPGIKRPTPKQR